MKITTYISVEVDEKVKTITLDENHISLPNKRIYSVRYNQVLDVVKKGIKSLIMDGYKVVYKQDSKTVLMVYNK